MSKKGARVFEIKVPIVTIITDKERHLMYTFAEFAEMAAKYEGVNNAMDTLTQGRVEDLTYFMWLGLKHEDPELTEEKVSRMFGIGNLTEVMEIINEAMGEAMMVDDPLPKEMKK